MARPQDESSFMRIVLEVWLVLWAVGLGLRWLPYARLRRLVDQIAPRLHSWRTTPAPADFPAQVVRALIVVQQRRGQTVSCLHEALTVYWLLRRRRLDAHLHIGVAKTIDERLIAHAWVESAGRIVSVDTASPAHYTPLVSSKQGEYYAGHFLSHRRHLPV